MSNKIFACTFLLVQVHAYFQDRGRYSAVCGVAVRAGGDLFVYDICRGESEGRVRLYECDDQQLKVQQTGEASYKVTKKDVAGYLEFLFDQGFVSC